MNRVVLRLGDLREAASKYGRIAIPKGARGTIPRTTEIHPDPHGVMVETPQMGTGVAAEGAWTEVIAVDHKRFHQTLNELKKAWADIGGDDARITLSSTVATVDLSWSDGPASRRISLPLWPARKA